MEKTKTKYAFPNTIVNDHGIIITGQNGITLRDYFASKVMNVLSPKIQKGFESPTDNDLKEWAEKCYRRADAMLKQSESI